METETITVFDFSVPGKVRAIGTNLYYPFSYSGPRLATVEDIKDMQAAVITAMQAAVLAVPLAAVPSAAAGAPTPASALTNPTKYTQNWTSLTLTPEDDIGKAIAVAAAGFKLALKAGGVYPTFAIPSGLDGWEIFSETLKSTDVKIDAGGGLTVAANNAAGPGTPGRLSRGKGAVWAGSPGHIHDLTITGGGIAAMGDHDGQAGLYWDCSNGECRSTRVIFRRNQNGCFGNTSNTNVHYIFDTDLFEGNGTDWGSHDTYVCSADTTTSRASYINCHAEGSLAGNNFKSRVPFVDVTGGFHGSKNANRWIDAANGAEVMINGGVFVANDTGQNVFENAQDGSGAWTGACNTTWDGSTIYIGNRSANFSTTGTFRATNVTVLWTGPNGSIFNDKGQLLTGLPGNPGSGFVPYPPVPPYVAGTV